VPIPPAVGTPQSGPSPEEGQKATVVSSSSGTLKLARGQLPAEQRLDESLGAVEHIVVGSLRGQASRDAWQYSLGVAVRSGSIHGAGTRSGHATDATRAIAAGAALSILA
jgi:hypothetical protein